MRVSQLANNSVSQTMCKKETELKKNTQKTNKNVSFVYL